MRKEAKSKGGPVRRSKLLLFRVYAIMRVQLMLLHIHADSHLPVPSRLLVPLGPLRAGANVCCSRCCSSSLLCFELYRDAERSWDPKFLSI